MAQAILRSRDRRDRRRNRRNRVRAVRAAVRTAGGRRDWPRRSAASPAVRAPARRSPHRCRSAGADSCPARCSRSGSRSCARACRRAGLSARIAKGRVSSRVAVSQSLGLERIADAAGGDREPALHHRADRAGFDAVLSRRASTSVSRLPPRPLPNVKSSPVTTPAAPIRSASSSATKSSAVVAGQLAVEMEHQHRVGPGGGEQLLALVERGQAEGRDMRREMAHRVRVEGRDDRRAALGLRPLDRLAHHRLVAEMEPVEIAERDHRAAQLVRHRLADGRASSGDRAPASRKRRRASRRRPDAPRAQLRSSAARAAA